MKRSAKVTVFFAALLLCGGCFSTLEKKFAFHPTSPAAFWRTLEDAGLEGEEVYFGHMRGPRLHGWFIPAAAPSASTRALLFCHGNGGNVADTLPRLKWLHRVVDAHILTFDYRGYGKSEGTPDEEGIYQDAEAAFDFLVRRPAVGSLRPIVVHGVSLGGAVAVELATRRPVAGLIVESSLTSADDMGRRYFPVLYRWWPGGHVRFASIEKISRVTAPLLSIHGDSDETVPYDMGMALYEGHAGPKEFLRVPGGRHYLFRTGGERYATAISNFVASASGR